MYNMEKWSSYFNKMFPKILILKFKISVLENPFINIFLNIFTELV